MKKVCLLLFCFVFFSSFGVSAAEITISAAASMRKVVDEIGNEFEKESGVKVIKNFTSSGKLAQQIVSGAPVDIYLSASYRWVRFLEKKDFLDRKDIKKLASNTLVLIAPFDTSYHSVSDMRKMGTIAMGDYRFSPCGKYAKESLENLGFWKDVDKKLVLARDVSQVVFWVMTGNVDGGIVYYTDFVPVKGKVSFMGSFPEDSHKPIAYFIAVVKESPNRRNAEKFVKFFLSKGDVLKKYGFSPVVDKW